MGDHTTETLLALQKRQNWNERYADHFFRENSLNLDEDLTSWILNHIDCFVSQSRGNKRVQRVRLWPHAFNGHDYDGWDKIGQAVGNLQALATLDISSRNFDGESEYFVEDDDGVVSPVPVIDWEILAQILRHVRQNVAVNIDDERRGRTTEEVQPFAQAIRGHPTIISLQDHGMFPYESLETLCSTLATLPALESVSFGAPAVRQADESTLVNPESLTAILRVPSLRSVRFD
jgi:hypothetical protein